MWDSDSDYGTSPPRMSVFPQDQETQNVTTDIFVSCRKGDVARVKFLVEKKEADLNVRDKWDSTPLYYACLCGHSELVKYLLENGAKCEANTFDGERCLYGALTNDIRQLLLGAKVITSQIKRRDDFDQFCYRLMNAAELSDLAFLMEDVHKFNVHRCILSVRSEYFKNQLQTKWRDRREVKNNMISAHGMEEFLKYIYTGRMVCQRDELSLFYRLADQCQMPQLREELDAAVVKADSFEGSKKGVHVTTISVESDKGLWELQQAYGYLLEQGLPPEFSMWPAANALPLMRGLPSTYLDLCLLVEDHRFYCHKLFLCERSGYFTAMLDNPFDEAFVDENGISVFRLSDICPETLACVLYYIYTNNAELTEEVVLDVLRVADIYLLVGLKRQCGAFLAQRVDADNIMTLFNLARLYDLPRLENRCTEYMASSIDVVSQLEDFKQAIIRDASEVKGRQDTDTISIIDDIRYHISSNVLTFSEVADANDKLQVIDDLLESLGLEA